MADPKTKIVEFNNQGVTTRLEPKQIPQGGFQYLLDISSELEGSITSRRGRKLIGNLPGGEAVPYMAAKMTVAAGEVPGTPSINYRYIGSTTNILRSQTLTTGSFTGVNGLLPVCTQPSSAALSREWTMATYNAGSTGNPWAFFACELLMLKDQGNPVSPYTPPLAVMQQWGILQAAGVAQAVSAGAGNLDGGASGSPPGSGPYKWIYCYVNPLTGNRGNPSIPMAADSQVVHGVPLALHNEEATVNVVGTGDPQITGPKSVAVFRTGGLLDDGIYRLVGYMANPGPNTTGAFTDNVSDVSLSEVLDLAEFDNDAPVTSTILNPYTDTLLGPVPESTTVCIAITPTGGVGPVRPGSLISLSGGANEETVVVFKVGFGQFFVYLQYAHAAGETITCDAIAGQPCNLTIAAFDSLFIAGDPNNPQALYKSKTGMPESFPTIDQAGIAHVMNVGTPSNGIVAITEFRGNVVALNQQNIFEVPVFNGIMYPPNVTPAQRGLAAPRAWCVVDNEIWYLAYDGIWSWSGGESVKRSEAIDGIFHGLNVTLIAGDVINAISMDPKSLQFARMEYSRRQVRFIYYIGPALTSPAFTLVYDLTFNRWLIYLQSQAVLNQGPSYLFLERDCGNLLFMRQDAAGGVICIDDALDSQGYTSDEFTTDARNQGQSIDCRASTGWMDLDNQYMSKVLDEVLIDIDPQGANPAIVQVQVFYDYNTGPARTFLIQCNTAGRAWQSIGLNLRPDNTPGGGLSTYGDVCNVVAFRFTFVNRGYRPVIYGMQFQYREISTITAGPMIDWTDMGHKHDKRLYQMIVTYDTNSLGYNLLLDMVVGVAGNSTVYEAQQFPISNPTIIGPGRAMVSLPCIDNLILKLARLRSVWHSGSTTAPSTAFFHILNVDWKYEPYPEDIVPFSEWDGGGSPFLKYAQQITFDVDTNGVPIQVQIQADGFTTQTVTIQTSSIQRRVNLTLLPNKTGFNWRFLVDTTQNGIAALGGKFQVFSFAFVFQAADRGAVGHTFDWDKLDHEWDKLLNTVTLEWDTSVGGSVTMQMDIIAGVGGGSLVPNVAQFVLSGGRSNGVFPLPPDTIAKMVRIYPLNDNVNFKQWKYSFDKIDYPADTISSTAWKDFGSHNDKNPSVLYIDADTNGQPVVVSVQDEAGQVMLITHTGTIHDRKRDYPFPPDNFGKMWRLQVPVVPAVPPAGSPPAPPPTVGIKFQLWDWGVEFLQDPADIIPFTAWNDFGWPYDKIGRNLILNVDTGGVPATVKLQTGEAGTVETFNPSTTYTNRELVYPIVPNKIGKLWRLVNTAGVGGKFKLFSWNLDFIKEPAAVNSWDSYEQTFGYKFYKLIKQIWWQYLCASSITLQITSELGVFTQVLPPHAGRTTERFYLPIEFAGGPNKSKTYIFALNSAAPFKFYQEGSGVEFLAIASDRHTGYQQMTFSEMLTLGEGE